MKSKDTATGPLGLGQFESSLAAWTRHILFAICDVEGNYFMNLAYRYTHQTSVTLLDAFNVPAIMLLSRYLLNARYTCSHVSSVVVCLVGLGLCIYSDALSASAR